MPQDWSTRRVHFGACRSARACRRVHVGACMTRISSEKEDAWMVPDFLEIRDFMFFAGEAQLVRGWCWVHKTRWWHAADAQSVSYCGYSTHMGRAWTSRAKDSAFTRVGDRMTLSQNDVIFWRWTILIFCLCISVREMLALCLVALGEASSHVWHLASEQPCAQDLPLDAVTAAETRNVANHWCGGM